MLFVFMVIFYSINSSANSKECITGNNIQLMLFYTIMSSLFFFTEVDNLLNSRVGNRAISAGPILGGSRVGMTFGEKQRYDRMRMTNTRTPRKTSRRGDFLIHPEWKPHIYHHRLNGLSSVDKPYTTSYR